VRVEHHNGRHYLPTESQSAPRQRVVLWHLRGSLDDLACVVSSTTFGFTLGLELAGESILVELQPDVERLTDKAARLEQWLLTQGWVPATDDRSGVDSI
jgi:hypothetical protein